MAVQSIIKNTVNLDEPIKKQILTDVLGGSDNQAHRFEVELTRGGQAVSLSGATVYGYFIRPGDITVKLTGGVSGSTAYVVLNDHCYVTPGRFSFAMKVQVGEVLHTVLLYEGCVAVTQGEGVVDDGYTIPSLTEWMNNIRKPNLLDNSDFRNPVNQRGGTSYTGTVYGIDRWYGRVNYQTVTPRSIDVTVTSTGTSYVAIKQKVLNIAKYAGKTLTFACNLWASVKADLRIVDASDNNIAYVTVEAGQRTIVLTFTVPTDATPDNCIPTILLRTTASGDYMRLYWAALYEGEYTAETLPEYVPKGYAVELAECRRYYRAFSTIQFPVACTTAGWVAVGVDYTGMRVTPSVSSYELAGVYINSTVYNTISSVSARALPASELTVAVTGATQGTSGAIRFNSLALSSDL